MVGGHAGLDPSGLREVREVRKGSSYGLLYFPHFPQSDREEDLRAICAFEERTSKTKGPVSHLSRVWFLSRPCCVYSLGLIENR
jgi:hypothetical protein